MLNRRISRTTLNRGLALSLSLVVTLGCTLHKATKAYDAGRYDEALVEYRKVLLKDPDNVKAMLGVRHSAPLAAEQHLARAKAAEAHGQDDAVYREVGMAVVLDPANAVAVDWMARLARAAERKRAKYEAEDSVDAERAKGEAVNALPINPRSLEGMDLNFTRKTSLKEIFQQLSKNSGVNIILHSSVSATDIQISVDLRGLTFQRVLDTLMLQSDLFYKVLDPNTIMVFKKTPQNLQEYENKLIQTFFLSNAEVESVRQIFNALMPQLRVFIDKRLNAITVMARPSDINIAKRIVSQLDKAKPEVMIYLELLEMAETTTEKFGLLPIITPLDTNGTYAIAATQNSALLNGSYSTQNGSLSINSSSIQYLLPSLKLDMAKTSGETKLLADPNVRVVSGETGEVNIGDKISTTQSSIGVPGAANAATTAAAATGSTAASTIAGALTSQTQYSYEDVGVNIKVKPRVHFNGDITIDLESTIKSLKAGGDPGRPNMTQRVIKTSARLRDGETAIFGGMLKEDEAKNLQGLWGITDIPVIGDLLANHNNQKSKVDVILSLRAVIVRKPDLKEDDFEAFDPDQAPSLAKPFAPQTPRATLNVPMNIAPVIPPSAAAQGLPEPLVPVPYDPRTGSAAPAPAPEAAPAGAAPAPAAPAEPAPAVVMPQGDAPAAHPGTGDEPAVAVPDARIAPAPEAKAAATDSDLVFFMNPLSTEVSKGQPVQLTLVASGAKGLTSGTMQLSLDPKLTLKSINPGDFITGDGGTLDSAPGAGGLVNLTFKRKGALDSGTLAVINLQSSGSGNAPVLVQGGQYLVGSNPISARVVNALVTVN
jgi:type II secretory pathway component GspD/PulD (secretin)